MIVKCIPWHFENLIFAIQSVFFVIIEFGKNNNNSGLAFTLNYVGHPISSDNGLISQKLVLKPDFYYPLHVTMGVAYSCLKYGVFITTWSDAIQICIQHYESPWPRKTHFKFFFCLGVELVRDALCFFGKSY